MGALPSRQSTEDPSTALLCNCGNQVVLHVPLTPHYFPSPTCLAFQQLFTARNNQSPLYAFDVRRLDHLLPGVAAEAFHQAQREDWGPEAEETDPSLHYYDANDGHSDDGDDGGSKCRHLRPSLEDAAALYHALVHAPTANGQLVDTNAELCAAYAQEQRWRASLPADGQQGSVAPPSFPFLYPLAAAIAVRLTPEEEKETRQLHREQEGMQRGSRGCPSHSPSPADSGNNGCRESREAAPLGPGLRRRRRYRFEGDESLRDGRVHLVEEDGVLYHFALNPDFVDDAGGDCGEAGSGYVVEPCPHDVVHGDGTATESLGSSGPADKRKLGHCVQCGSLVSRDLTHSALVTFPSTHASSGGGGGGARVGRCLIPISALRVVGVHGLLPATSRGTPWLRGTDQWPASVDAQLEALGGDAPPVMRLCRFIDGSIGEKVLNRAALVSLVTYRDMCLCAGLPDSLVRPLWSLCVKSNIPYVQMVRETFFRARASVVEVDDKDHWLRHKLWQEDRENNVLNFINTNLSILRKPQSPYDKQVRREPEENGDEDGARDTKKEEVSVADTPAKELLPQGHGQRQAEGHDESMEERQDQMCGGDSEGSHLHEGDNSDMAASRKKDFLRFISSRLEPHAPLLLEAVFEPSAGRTVYDKLTSKQMADADCCGDSNNHNEENSGRCRCGDGPGKHLDSLVGARRSDYERASLENRAFLNDIEGYFIAAQHERWEAMRQLPREQRPRSFPLYDCGMVESIRGRHLLFRCRADALSALLYYCGKAAAPVFIGSYMLPTDATGLSYGGGILLDRRGASDRIDNTYGNDDDSDIYDLNRASGSEDERDDVSQGDMQGSSRSSSRPRDECRGGGRNHQQHPSGIDKFKSREGELYTRNSQYMNGSGNHGDHVSPGGSPSPNEHRFHCTATADGQEGGGAEGPYPQNPLAASHSFDRIDRCPGNLAAVLELLVRGMVLVFTISDPSGAAAGPNANHRLRKLFPAAAKPDDAVMCEPEEMGDIGVGGGGGPSLPSALSEDAERGKEGERIRCELRRQQQYEREVYSHVYSYAPNEFKDGDLVVYNCQTRMWEHYEHVMLRRQFTRLRTLAWKRSVAQQQEQQQLRLQQQSGEGDGDSDHLFSRSDDDGDGGDGGRRDGHANEERGGGGNAAGTHESSPITVSQSDFHDAGMAGRLLYCSLDVLLLSWTKWVVDNRFYEDRNDAGWLKCPDGPFNFVLLGRYCIWSFRLNRHRYFYGVIPKFIKDKLRRQRGTLKKKLNKAHARSAVAEGEGEKGRRRPDGEGTKRNRRRKGADAVEEAEEEAGTVADTQDREAAEGSATGSVASPKKTKKNVKEKQQGDEAPEEAGDAKDVQGTSAKPGGDSGGASARHTPSRQASTPGKAPHDSSPLPSALAPRTTTMSQRRSRVNRPPPLLAPRSDFDDDDDGGDGNEGCVAALASHEQDEPEQRQPSQLERHHQPQQLHNHHHPLSSSNVHHQIGMGGGGGGGGLPHTGSLASLSNATGAASTVSRSVALLPAAPGGVGSRFRSSLLYNRQSGNTLFQDNKREENCFFPPERRMAAFTLSRTIARQPPPPPSSSSSPPPSSQTGTLVPGQWGPTTPQLVTEYTASVPGGVTVKVIRGRRPASRAGSNASSAPHTPASATNGIDPVLASAPTFPASPMPTTAFAGARDAAAALEESVMKEEVPQPDSGRNAVGQRAPNVSSMSQSGLRHHQPRSTRHHHHNPYALQPTTTSAPATSVNVGQTVQQQQQQQAPFPPQPYQSPYPPAAVSVGQPYQPPQQQQQPTNRRHRHVEPQQPVGSPLPSANPPPQLHQLQQSTSTSASSLSHSPLANSPSGHGDTSRLQQQQQQQHMAASAATGTGTTVVTYRWNPYSNSNAVSKHGKP